MKKFLAILLMLAMCLPCACAETFTLPADLEVIEAEAFRAVEELDALVIPSTVTAIGDYAFADCPNLYAASIPGTVTSVGRGAFSGSQLPLLITTDPGSAAMTYALGEGIDFNADSTFRALLIGQSSYPGDSVLLGPLTDVNIMKTILSRFDGTPFTSTVKTNLSADGIKASIATVFAGAKEQDVSLFYYSGHGASSGSLVGVDETYVSAATLRSCLDQIPGRKIVIVDACYSGALIGKSTTATQSDDAFVSAFMTAFTRRDRSTNLAASSYYVITAAHSSQLSVELASGNRHFGVFTVALAKGCGYDYWDETDCENLADVNSDGVITLQEAYAYARVTANTMFAPYGVDVTQTAQVWPNNCTAFGLLRE